MIQQLILKEYNGFEIQFEVINGQVMANATLMATAFGKRSNDYITNKSTRAYIKALTDTGKVVSAEAKVVRKGGVDQGTWLHQKIVLDFARWLSPLFAIWCDEQIAEIIKGTQHQLPTTHAGALRELADSVEKNTALQQKIEQDKPLIESQKQLMAAVNDLTVMQTAKTLGVGRNKLFAILRHHDIFISDTKNHNTPYQTFITRGYFIVRQVTKVVGKKGREKVKAFSTAYVTTKGLEWLRKSLVKHGYIIKTDKGGDDDSQQNFFDSE